jgi:hypothetical protein
MLVTTYPALGAQPASLVGSQAPRFRGIDLRGSRLEVPASGSPTVVVFWNSRYRVSADALSAMQRLYDMYKKKGLVCAGLNDLGEDASLAKQVASQLGITFPLFTGRDTVGAAASYRVRGVPVVFVIDQTGLVISVEEGFGPGAEARVAGSVVSLL